MSLYIPHQNNFFSKIWESLDQEIQTWIWIKIVKTFTFHLKNWFNDPAYHLPTNALHEIYMLQIGSRVEDRWTGQLLFKNVWCDDWHKNWIQCLCTVLSKGLKYEPWGEKVWFGQAMTDRQQEVGRTVGDRLFSIGRPQSRAILIDEYLQSNSVVINIWVHVYA